MPSFAIALSQARQSSTALKSGNSPTRQNLFKMANGAQVAKVCQSPASRSDHNAVFPTSLSNGLQDLSNEPTNIYWAARTDIDSNLTSAVSRSTSTPWLSSDSDVCDLFGVVGDLWATFSPRLLPPSSPEGCQIPTLVAPQDSKLAFEVKPWLLCVFSAPRRSVAKAPSANRISIRNA